MTVGDSAFYNASLVALWKLQCPGLKEIKLRPTATYKMHFRNNVATLVFNQVDSNDSGEYICRAENSVGEVSSLPS